MRKNHHEALCEARRRPDRKFENDASVRARLQSIPADEGHPGATPSVATESGGAQAIPGRRRCGGGGRGAEEQTAGAPIAGSYVPDGLSAEEWAELQARERAPKGDLGSWGSKVGGESEPQRGDLMSQPTIWTNPSAFFNERAVGEQSIQSDESRPNIFDLDDEDEDKD